MSNCLKTTLKMVEELMIRGNDVMILSNKEKSRQIIVNNKIKVIVSDNYIRLGKSKEKHNNNNLLTKGVRNLYKYFSIKQYKDAVELILKF